MYRVLIVAVAGCGGAEPKGERSGDLEPIPLNLVVLVDDPRAPTRDSVHLDPEEPGQVWSGEELLVREVEILNEYFLASDGGPVCDEDGCISFELGAIWFYEDITDTSCALLDYGRMTDPEILQSRRGMLRHMDRSVERCDDERLVAPGTINFYVYDFCEWDTETDAADCDPITSHGTSNTGEDGRYYPLVAIDLERLQHQTQSPEEHELGHALGLQHVCDPTVTDVSQDSNIMQSSCSCECAGGDECVDEGSGGARTLGFGVVSNEIRDCEVDQVSELMGRAREFQSQWEDDLSTGG